MFWRFIQASRKHDKYANKATVSIFSYFMLVATDVGLIETVRQFALSQIINITHKFSLSFINLTF